MITQDLTDVEAMLVARIAHEANRAWCEFCGDHSIKPWEDAPEWQRESAIDGVRSIASGKVTSPKASHDNWLAHKRAAGWTYGAHKDEEAKTHPCMVPYDKLPAHQRAKDTIFSYVVRAALKAVVFDENARAVLRPEAQ